MIGQVNLLNNLSKYTSETLPHSILLLGPKGCGKHLLCERIAEIAEADLVDMTGNINLDYIQNMYLSSIPTVYMIDVNKLTEKQQNIILKLLEEPTDSIYLVLICTSRALLLDTVVNRCQQFIFEPYSVDELSKFLKVDCPASVLKYCQTPGQVESINYKELEQMEIIVNELVHTIKYSDFLSKSREIIEKEYDLDLFYNILANCLYEEYSNTNSTVAYNMYYAVTKAVTKLTDSRFARRNLLDSLMDDLWHATYGK